MADVTELLLQRLARTQRGILEAAVTKTQSEILAKQQLFTEQAKHSDDRLSDSGAFRDKILAQRSIVMQIREKLESRLKTSIPEFESRLEKLAKIDAELHEIREANRMETESLVDSLLASPVTDREDMPKIVTRNELEELGKQVMASYKREVARIDKEESTSKKKLLLSMY